MHEKSLINENPSKYKVIIAKMVWKTSVFNEVINCLGLFYIWSFQARVCEFEDVCLLEIYSCGNNKFIPNMSNILDRGSINCGKHLVILLGKIIAILFLGVYFFFAHILSLSFQITFENQNSLTYNLFVELFHLKA